MSIKILKQFIKIAIALNIEITADNLNKYKEAINEIL